jgi:hypothetical protein
MEASPSNVKEFGHLVVQECVPEAFKDCDRTFSGLDSDVAGDIGVYSRFSAEASTKVEPQRPHS